MWSQTFLLIFSTPGKTDLCQWKREVKKFSFKNIAFKEQPKISPYRRCGEKGEKIFFFFFFLTAQTVFFSLQLVNTPIKISSCDDRRSIST